MMSQLIDMSTVDINKDVITPGKKTRRFETYNIHDGQNVLLDITPAVIANHHLVGDHQGLNVALSADGAF